MFRKTLGAAAIASALTIPSYAMANDIVDIAAGNEAFSTLVAAVTAAGLVDTLKGEGPFTVFAPTDEAFAALPAGTVEGLLNDIPALTAILTYHVVPGKVMSGDLAAGCADVATVNGATAQVCKAEGVTIAGANVTSADIEATNGVIHVIDAVILPPQ